MKTAPGSNLILSALSDSAILSMSAYTMSQLPGITFTKTNESIYVGANPYCAHLFGLTDPRQIIGLNDYELKTEVVESADDFRNEDKIIFANGELNTFLHINKGINGKRYIFLTQKIPVKNYQGKVIGLNCVANEIINPSVTKTILYLLHANKFFSNFKEKNFNLGVDDGRLFNELTAFENEVLYLFNIGFSKKDIGFMENITSSQFINCLELIKFKLKCNYYQDVAELCFKRNYHAIIPKTLLDKIFSQTALPNIEIESMDSNVQLCRFVPQYQINAIAGEANIQQLDFDTIFSITSEALRDLLTKRNYSISLNTGEISLTKMEICVLVQLLKGAHAGLIAQELGIKQTTVESYLVNIKNKLAVDTKNELINLITSKKILQQVIL